MFKIGICGAHGTGKTTLAKLLTERINLPFLTDTTRQMWRDFGVEDFEKLPPTVRTYFQKEVILRQTNREDIEGENGFITDRTVMDNWCYTKLSANFDPIDLRVYEALVKARLKTYSHFIYIPVSLEFRVEQEKLRANLETQNTFASIIEESLEWVEPNKLLVLKSVDLEERVKEVVSFLGIE
jgi:deoxyadenosine/deoxycytidine kinase